MNAGATTERVLVTLRRYVVSLDARPGQRLDPASLAQRMEASLTPIREALHMLIGESLVESRFGGGFAVPILDAEGLHHRYEWCGQMLAAAIHAWPRRRLEVPPFPNLAGYPTIADRCAALFLYIAKLSGNREHARAMQRLNSRLHHVRLMEDKVLSGLEEELIDIWKKVQVGDRRDILSTCAIYHRRRMKHVKQISRKLI